MAAYICPMTGIVQGTQGYGTGINILFWIISLFVAGVVGVGIYWLIKPIKK